MFKKTFIVAAMMAILATPAVAGNNNGPKFGGGDSNATALGVGIGVGNAKASANASAGAAAKANNSTTVGVGVKNNVSNAALNKVNNHNANFGVNSQGQSLKNYNDLSNRNINNNTANGGEANQGQLQGQMQGQQQSSKQANAQSLTYNEANGMHYSGDYTVRQAPGIVAPSIPPSAGCQKPVSGGLSGTLGGVTFGTTYTDETCIMYEDIRFGLQGNAESQHLANMVIQNRLMGHLEDQDEVARVSQDTAKGYASATANSGIWALTDY